MHYLVDQLLNIVLRKSMQKKLRLIISWGLIITSCAQKPSRDVIATPQLPPMAKSDRGLVVTCQSLAAQVGLDILKGGGSAADAFVAATVAEYVTAPGYTSLSGPLYVLYYDKKSGKTTYLNAGLNTVTDRSGQWSDQKQIPGTSYVVGGAGRGLEALYSRFGSRTFKFKDLIAPSVALAKNGFLLDRSFAGAIRTRTSVLKNSSAWMSIYTSSIDKCHPKYSHFSDLQVRYRKKQRQKSNGAKVCHRQRSHCNQRTCRQELRFFTARRCCHQSS